MCIISWVKQKIKKSSPYLSSNEKIEFLISCLETKKGIGIIDIDNGVFNLECYLGEGYAVSLYEDDKVTVSRAWYKEATVTTKHYHKRPTVEHISIVEGKVIIKLLNEDGHSINKKDTLIAGETYIVPPEVPHVLHFLEKTELIITAIPKDKYNA